ncbi:MAG: hypothetical protein ACOX7N_02050 [Lawsonibacter sp.]
MNLPIVPPTMGYHAARILLKDGKITHRAMMLSFTVPGLAESST